MKGLDVAARFYGILHVLVIIVVGLAAYSNTFSVPFLFDDTIYLSDVPTVGNQDGRPRFKLPNPNIIDFSYAIDPARAGSLDPEIARHPYLVTRYMGYRSLLLNYEHSGFEVFSYHVVNLSIHIINALFVYLLVLLCFVTPRLAHAALKKQSRHIALVAGLVFVAHPVQTEAVTYIAQRFVELAAGFYLASCLGYAGFRLSTNTAVKTGLFVVSLLAAVAAMMTKEIALTLPFAIVLLEFMFFEGALRKRLIAAVPFFLTLLIIPAAYLGQNAGESIGAALYATTRFQTELSRSAYLYTQFGVIAAYLGLLLLPIGQNADHHYPVCDSLFQTRVFLPLIAILALLGTALYLLKKSQKKPELRLVSFGLLWFFFTLSVESSIVPFSQIMVEYRIYLPSAGFIIAFVVMLWESCKIKHPVISLLCLPVVVLLIISLASGTYVRNAIWKSDLTFWQAVVEKSPKKVRGYINLGKALRSANRPQEAIECYQKAIALEPSNIKLLNNLANACSSVGRHREAISYFETLLGLGLEASFSSEVCYNIAHAYEQQDNKRAALQYYRKALKENPWNIDAYNNIGVIYLSQKAYSKAKEYFLLALDRNPKYVTAYFNLGEVFLASGEPKQAIQHFRTFQKSSPDYSDTYRKIGDAYKQLGMTAESEKHYRIADSLETSNN
ncbi:tetratricopeptide repeat protein [Thermodesulfobacteriota bacterium]